MRRRRRRWRALNAARARTAASRAKRAEVHLRRIAGTRRTVHWRRRRRSEPALTLNFRSQRFLERRRIESVRLQRVVDRAADRRFQIRSRTRLFGSLQSVLNRLTELLFQTRRVGRRASCSRRRRTRHRLGDQLRDLIRGARRSRGRRSRRAGRRRRTSRCRTTRSALPRGKQFIQFQAT